MNTPTGQVWLRIFILGLVVVTGATSGIAGGKLVDSTTDTAAIGGSDIQYAANETNETVQHEKPSTVNQNGNEADIRRWLSSRMGALLEQSSINISQGQYQRADALLGEQYESYVEKYVEVTGPTEGDDDTRTPEAFNRTRQLLQKLSSARAQFNQTYRAYQMARQAGNKQRARQLARELMRLAEQINQTAAKIQNTTSVIESQTDVQLTTVTQVANSTRTVITNRTHTVIADLFVTPSLTASSASQKASFLQPVRITGTLQVPPNQTPPDSVTLHIGNQRFSPNLSSSGHYSIMWRPRTVSAGLHPVTIRYIPNQTSPYLGAATNISLTVKQIQPTLVSSIHPDAVGFGDQLTVSGHLTANKTGISRIPIAVWLPDGTQVRTMTTQKGTYSVTLPISATIAPGHQPVTVVVPLTGKAIEGVRNSPTIEITETPTAMTAQARVDNGTLHIAGQLATLKEVPVPSQPVTITVRNRTLMTVQTNTTGWYQASVSTNGFDIRNGTSVATVRYRGSGTNLAGSTATATFKTPVAASNGGLQGLLQKVIASPWLWLGGILALLASGWWLRRRNQRISQEGEDSRDPALPSDVDGSKNETASTQSDVTDGLTEAHQAIHDGASTQAILSAYAAVRAHLANGDSGATPREFYQVYERELSEDRRAALATLTQAYETAAFAPDPVDESDAETAITAAQHLKDSSPEAN